ncbi:hypothetical protein HG530_013757 [Fusarium avenaceum]|nr:hypothetical protein HG530_013757 [Fusarium avenaceum]KIL87351.1 hypothetical protein FAVG1_09055 [Fusarium avenaceum]
MTNSIIQTHHRKNRLPFTGWNREKTDRLGLRIPARKILGIGGVLDSYNYCRSHEPVLRCNGKIVPYAVPPTLNYDVEEQCI